MRPRTRLNATGERIADVSAGGTRSMTRVIANVRWGVSYGVRIALIFSVIAWLALLVAGPTDFEAATEGASIFEVTALYFGLGAIGGMIVGLLRPLLRWRAGAALVGVLVGTLVYFFGGMVALHRWRIDLPYVVVFGSMSVVGGAIGGLVMWEIFRSPDSGDSKRND